MLANPGSTLQADVDRRARVRQWNVEFEAVCAAYRQCHYDGNVAFGTAFERSDVTTRDYFHPSVSGQAKLASVSWSASPWGPDHARVG